MRSGRGFKPWDTRPRLDPRLTWVWDAYHELQTCRPLSMAVGPIPWTAIHTWADANDVADQRRFERLVRALDTVFLEEHHKRDEAHGGT